jgi:hypothetical protein
MAVKIQTELPSFVMRDSLGRPTGAMRSPLRSLVASWPGALLRQRARWQRLGFRHAPNRAAASVEPFGSRVTGHPARREGPSGTAAAGRAIRALGPCRPWERFARTIPSTEGDRHGDLNRANESPAGTEAPRTSEIHGWGERGRSPRDCGARLRRRGKRRPGSAGASRQPFHHRHAPPRSAMGNGVTTAATPLQ